MKRNHAPAPASPPAAEDRSWAARAEGLKRERPAQLALVFAMAALMAALCGWTAVLIPSGRDPRFSAVFWLMAAPLMIWVWSAQSCASWVVRTLWLVLLLAPCLSLLAMVVAPALQRAAMLQDGAQSLGTPFALLVILGLTSLLALAGAAALHRSSLPGGTRPIHYVTPGTMAPGALVLAPEARSALMLGSLPFSGTLINGCFFAIVETIDAVGPWSTVWPALLVGAMVLCVGTLVFRGGYRLSRQRLGAAADLRRGWTLGMGCAIAAIPALWASPMPISAKLGMSCFMVPMAIAATWCGRAALRALPEIAGEA